MNYTAKNKNKNNSKEKTAARHNGVDESYKLTTEPQSKTPKNTYVPCREFKSRHN